MVSPLTVSLKGGGGYKQINTQLPFPLWGSALTPGPFQSASCFYRFLISSKAKWSTPTDMVLMTLRLAPVMQKKHCLYLSSWDSNPPHWGHHGAMCLL